VAGILIVIKTAVGLCFVKHFTLKSHFASIDEETEIIVVVVVVVVVVVIIIIIIITNCMELSTTREALSC
jgi:uncharacterized membrane protein